MARFPTIFACAALLVSVPAAAAPTLSGSYASSQRNFCQVIETIDSSTGAIAKIDSAGDFTFGVSTITFDPGAGTATAAGFGAGGSPLVAEFTDGSKKGRYMKLFADSSSGSYSNDDTTLTFNGGAPYQVVYGPVVNGVATSFVGVLQDNQGHYHCTEQIDAQHQ